MLDNSVFIKMTSGNYISWITTITVFVGLFSIIYQGFLAAKNLQDLTHVLRNLVRLENSNSSRIALKPKIAIGYGACSDLYVHAPTFLNYTDWIENNSDTEFDGDINSEEELLLSFAYYFKHGAAAERYTKNSALFQSLLKRAKADKTNIRWSIGGNAPIMSLRFLREGAEILLASEMSRKLRDTLPKEINMIGDPVAFDDVHMILEYKAHEKWGPLEAPRANRYIIHNDQNNPVLKTIEPFATRLLDFDPRLLVVSGIQMMDNYPFAPEIREDRLKILQDQITSVKPSTLVHFEMASFVEIELLHLINKNILPYVNSIGMNEQELDNLEQMLKYGKISKVADSNPKVSMALAQMRGIFTQLNKNYSNDLKGDKTRRLISRIHVHTLAYQAFLIVRDQKYDAVEWKNTENAAAKSALTACRHVCGSDVINPESSYLVLDESFSTATNDPLAPKRINFSQMDPVSCWNEKIIVNENTSYNVEICLAPVLVCRVAKQTAGAGDNISAAGLILQL